MKAKLLLTIFGLVLQLNSLYAQPQRDSLALDSLSLSALDSTTVQVDSIALDSLGLPISPTSTQRSFFEEITLSEDALEDRIDYKAQDSMIYDLKNQKIYLYGNAEVTYTTINLKAAIIEFDWTTNTVSARGRRDSTGILTGKPQFADGDQQFTAKEMKYNFKTRKGVIQHASTIQNNLYVIGEKAKFISADPSDTTQNDLIYNKDAIFTTCDHPHPHFGIRSNKQKVIPNNLVIVGPSNVEIMGVPTPLWLPFGFFPISSGKSTGLLFPRDYEYSDNWGFGLRNVGWYFPLGDQMDLQLTSDIYLKGSYRLRAVSSYARRYKYRGSARFEFHSLRNENSNAEYVRDRSFIINLSHNQDGKAHPSRNIGGNINIQTNNAQSRNYNDAESVLNSTLGSNFSYRESFPGKPFNLAVGFNHSQNTQTRSVRVDFPTVNFQTQTLYPFKGKPGTGDKWYKKIALTYRGEAKAQILATDTTLFEQETLDNIQFGARHQVGTNASFKLLKYVNFNPRVDYSEVWFFKTLSREFDDTEEIIFEEVDEDGEIKLVPVDTIFGTVMDTLLYGWNPLRKFSTGFSMDTKLFATKIFSGEDRWLKGLRHVMTPRVGFTFTPDYTDEKWGYFEQVQEDTRFPDELLEYTIFNTGGLYSNEAPSSVGRQMAITYGLKNFFEAKVFSRKDSSYRNVRILKRFDFDGSYNFAAEEFKFSTVRFNATGSAFNNIFTFLISATFDPYGLDGEGNRQNVLLWQSDRKIARLTDARYSLTTSLTVRKIREIFKPDKVSGPGPGNSGSGGRNSNNTSNDFFSMFEDFSINHNFIVNTQIDGRMDTTFISANSITFRGSVPLSQKWNVAVGNFGYDFSKMDFTFPSFTISRDLHCWEMGLSWQPTRSTYAFFLRVDPGSMLDFLKIPYGKGIQDTGLGGGFSGF